MIGVFFAAGFVLVSTFVLGYAAALIRPEPQYFPRHTAEVLKIQPGKHVDEQIVPFLVGRAA